MQNFVDGVVPTIKSAWLNAVDVTLNVLGYKTTAAELRTALGSTTVGDALFIAATAAAARSTLVVPSTTEALLLTGGSMSGAINGAWASYTTPSATPDIWSAGSNMMFYANSTTVTGLPNAPQAGAERILVSTGEWKFTTSTFMVIEGVVAGTTVTMNNGAIIRVRAYNNGGVANQFSLSYDLSGSLTPTYAGFSAAPTTADLRYSVHNGVVTLSIPNVPATGSNATTFTMNNALPLCVRPVTKVSYAPLPVIDNGSASYTYTGRVDVETAGTLTYSLVASASGGFTAANTKGAFPCTITYFIQ